MKRRDFLAAGMGGVVVSVSDGLSPIQKAIASLAPEMGSSPNAMKLHVKPVLTSIVHTGSWEGPCRWTAMSPAEERRQAGEAFARWSQELREKGLAGSSDVKLLEPAHVLFSEDFTIHQEEWDKLAPESEATDVFYIVPAGSSISAYEIGNRFGKPILMRGLSCRTVDIAAYAKAKGNEAFLAADDAELARLLSLLRARKVLRSTRVLFPTDRGLPAACSVGSIWDLQGLEKRLGVAVKTIPYRELAEEMERVQADEATTAQAAEAGEQLLCNAHRSHIDKEYLVKSLQFYRAVDNLMARHAANAFTIECFELCSSKLAAQWQITPCLVHGLLKDRGLAASCEGDLGSLLAIQLLTTISGKSCHQGNSDPRGEGTFRINHSNPALKMNGFDQPELPYQLGRFVSEGWGAKYVVDFMNNEEKTVTVARVDPTARKLLVLKGELVGASGWGPDLIGCSVEAVIRPPQGTLDRFLRERMVYGNHLQWVYGDYAEEMREVGEMLHLEVEVIA